MIGLLGGGFLVFALTQGGFVPAGGRRTQTTRPAYGAESRDMLEMRQRVMIASLKELEQDGEGDGLSRAPRAHSQSWPPLKRVAVPHVVFRHDSQ